MKVKIVSSEVFQGTESLSELKKEFGPVADDIVRTLSNRMDKAESEFLKKCLKEIQKRTNLTVEFVRYLVQSAKTNHKEAINTIHSDAGIESEMGRFKRFLKLNNVKTKPVPYYFKRKTLLNGGINKQPARRMFHLFKLD